MPYEVQETEIELKEENKFYRGEITDVFEEEGNYGPQLKWIIVLDEDKNAYTDDEGNPTDRETWAWCGAKLTTHENNKFRKWVKGLTGKEPAPGQVVDEKEFIGQRVGVMFEHATKSDGTKYDKVILLVDEAKLD